VAFSNHSALVSDVMMEIFTGPVELVTGFTVRFPDARGEGETGESTLGGKKRNIRPKSAKAPTAASTTTVWVLIFVSIFAPVTF
jgi:hypothetical protein